MSTATATATGKTTAMVVTVIATQPVYEWKDLDWTSIEKQVFKLQKRIYQASKRGDIKAVHRLQKLLMKSWSAKCLATRKVTQDNRGKRTAGVDGVRALAPKQRLELARSLQPSPKSEPTRRVWIPKPGTTEKRPLGIPTMRNRAEQALVKLALEPEWEAKFEPNSYGFRPGRSAHDAIEAIFGSIKQKAKYVLDADIAKCFERIDQEALLNKLKTYPTLRRVIRSWLRAGVVDGNELFPTTEGTPQGGVASPLLANVALHGLEEAITSAFPNYQRPTVVRFADDFVVLHADLPAIEKAQRIAAEWLANMGLELKPSKTKISHTLHEHNGAVGFDFLGWTVRQYPVGKTHTGKNSNGKQLGFKTLIKPSRQAIKRHSRAIGELIDKHRTAPQTALINHLNPLIRGWSNYHSSVVSKRTFNKMDHETYLKLRRWAKRRHNKKPWYWIIKKYWRVETGRWIFGAREGVRLHNHSRTPIQRHTKVKDTRSPFDGDWIYWARRLGRHPELPRTKAELLKRQGGKCAWCGLYFEQGEQLMEADHDLPERFGGSKAAKNRQLLHGYCHDQKTAQDGSLLARGRGIHDKSRVVEEPDEAKVSRPDLQTSRKGDRPA